MASSSLSTSQPCKYDVFLSFRGEDTRKNFVDHFYSALVRQAIHTYKDDETLPRGESISPSLFTAIRESRIAVIIFSKNYANSSWCLEELSYIMECKEVQGLIVMPVFFHVEPSQVRKQMGEFGKGFARQLVDNINKVESWRKALVAASEISGWEAKNIADGHESKVIEKIVDTILDRLLSISLNVNEDLVGMTTRLRDLESRLDMQSDCVRMVGIWGVGGSGKTTLANSLYKRNSHLFEGSCIVESIREKSIKYDLEKLQEKILFGVFKKEVRVSGVEEGKDTIKQMLCRRKVLIVLDDIDKLDQLEALAGSCDWFGRGSRIMVTTRDKHLLNTHKVNDVYHVRLLSDDEAIQLFDKHAYNGKKPINNYKELSSNVVSYAVGLPLALKILGKFLYDKDEEGWKSALARLKAIPEEEIVERLKISYDGLKKEEKEIFLDIACFFRKGYTHLSMKILEACGFHAAIGIEVLRQKALITIDADDKFDMHDLVQEMGHYIVRRGHPDNPENHSRVWKQEEINDMCFEDATMVKENDKIEGLQYYNPKVDEEHYLGFHKIVSNMKKLRFLKVDFGYKSYTNGSPTFLSNQLRYIDWNGYPESPFPNNFKLTKLVVLKLSLSSQKELWKGKKFLPHLKELVILYMKCLESTPDFDGLPRLQKFTLSMCYHVKEIHPSLGNHRNLESVIVSNCTKLTMFPTIVHMEKLKTVKIDGCNNIHKFPEIVANMECLVKLSLSGIGVVPSSIGDRCTNLTSLELSYFDNRSIEFNWDELKNLRHLKFRPRFEDEEIPSKIGELSNLEELDLSSNNFTRLDFSLLHLTRLKLVNLTGCSRLVELPELPSSVAILIADRCYLLTGVKDFHRYCKRLSMVSIVGGRHPVNDGDRLLKSMLQGEAVESGSIVVRLEGLEIAKGFTPHLLKGDTFTMQLPKNWSNDFCGFLMCAVSEYSFTMGYVEISMKHVMSGTLMDAEDDEVVWEESTVGHDKVTWVGYVSFASLRQTWWWHPTSNKLSFSISNPHFSCNGFGVRLVGSITSGSGPSSSPFSSDFKIKHGLTIDSMSESGPTDASQFAQPFKIIHDSRPVLSIRENSSYAR